MITRITDMFTLFDLSTMCEVRPCASLRDGATRKQHAKKHFNAIPKNRQVEGLWRVRSCQQAGGRAESAGSLEVDCEFAAAGLCVFAFIM